jgi:hypothetical protein
MNVAERAKKIAEFVRPHEETLQKRLDEVRKEKAKLLRTDKDADVRDLTVIERVLHGFVVNLSSGRVQLEELR